MVMALVVEDFFKLRSAKDIGRDVVDEKWVFRRRLRQALFDLRDDVTVWVGKGVVAAQCKCRRDGGEGRRTASC